jgi:hypothetical protein
VASPQVWQIYPAQTVSAWLFNGVSPGPALTATEGDTVEVAVTNHLPEPLTVSFPTDDFTQAGLPGLSQKPIWPGQSYAYRFTAPAAGTYTYQSSFDMLRQVNFGLSGPFIVKPQSAGQGFDDDYTVSAGEWPAPADYDAKEATYFTLNGHSYPATEPLWVKRGDRVRLRLINSGAMMWHVFELEGHDLWLIARDGRPLASPEPAETVVLGPGQSADVAFVADNPGNWPLLCNVLDHTMNLNLPGPGGMELLVRYQGYSGGQPPAANELGVAENLIWRAESALAAGDRQGARARYRDFLASWGRIGRDVEQVDPDEALRIDQVIKLTDPVWNAPPQSLPQALQGLDDVVVQTVDNINGFRVGLPQP